MRLIDADALLQMIHDHQCADCESVKADRNGVACAACQWDDAISMIESAPAIIPDDDMPRRFTGVNLTIRRGVMLPGEVSWDETD